MESDISKPRLTNMEGFNEYDFWKTCEVKKLWVQSTEELMR